MTNPNNYQHYKLDLDGCYYRFIDSDVQMFTRSMCPKIDDIFHNYRALIQQHLYIIGNYIFFTYNGVKYWDIISSSTDESNYIQDIKRDLIKLGCKDIVYDCGHLD